MPGLPASARRGVRAGSRSATGNRVDGGNSSRGFESHPLRHILHAHHDGRPCQRLARRESPRGEVAELAECGGLENRYASRGASGVRIPPSPPFAGLFDPDCPASDDSPRGQSSRRAEHTRGISGPRIRGRWTRPFSSMQWLFQLRVQRVHIRGRHPARRHPWSVARAALLAQHPTNCG